MDLTRSITFAGFDLNDATPQLGRPGLVGCSIDAMDISPLSVEQYVDKTYANEGMDFQGVGNLNVASRAVSLQGSLYGDTRGDLWDRLVALRTAFDPVQCWSLAPDDEGFLPLAWMEPRASGPVNRLLYVRPHDFHWAMSRDQQGTSAKVAGKADAVGLALQWSVTFANRDPRVYGLPHAVNVGVFPTGSLANDGDYPTPISLTLILSSASGSVGVVMAGADFRLTIEAGTSGRILHYRGLTKLLTLEDPAHGDREVLRQDVLSFSTVNSDTQHPSLLPGSSPYALTPTGLSVLSGTVTYRDAYS